VREADPSPEEAKVIHDLGDSGYGGARVVAAVLLINADGRRESFDAIAVGFLHLTEELPRIGTQALDITTLSLGVQGVEGEA